MHTAIESITNYREPQPQEAMYLLMPTTQNVDRVIRDFADGRKQYGAAHLFFIEGTSSRARACVCVLRSTSGGGGGSVY